MREYKNLASLPQSGQLCGFILAPEILWDQPENRLQLEPRLNFCAVLPPSLPYRCLPKMCLSKSLAHEFTSGSVSRKPHLMGEGREVDVVLALWALIFCDMRDTVDKVVEEIGER